MPTSAERRRTQSGFLLLEVMVTVALIGGLILPILLVRESAQNRAYHSGHIMRALQYAEVLLANSMREPTPQSSQEGYVEDDRAFRYEILIEDWDLGTGRSEKENEEDEDNQDFGTNSVGDGSNPLDAGIGGVEEDDRNNPHKVRRFEVEVFWPGLEPDKEDSLVLEGFLPRIWEETDAYGRSTR